MLAPSSLIQQELGFLRIEPFCKALKLYTLGGGGTRGETVAGMQNLKKEKNYKYKFPQRGGPGESRTIKAQRAWQLPDSYRPASPLEPSKRTTQGKQLEGGNRQPTPQLQSKVLLHRPSGPGWETDNV